jgi:AbrB family looped-hinge helix DNA binding protein
MPQGDACANALPLASLISSADSFKEELDMRDGHADSVCNCRLDNLGRIILPKSLRSAASLQGGDELVITIENGSIVMRSFDEAIQKLLDEFCEGIPEGVSLADELIAERRA